MISVSNNNIVWTPIDAGVHVKSMYNIKIFRQDKFTPHPIQTIKIRARGWIQIHN